MQGAFPHRTKKLNLEINFKAGIIKTSDIKTSKSCFDSLCKSGCRNFSSKYSCPPAAPCFSELASNYNYLLTYIFWLDLDQIKIKNAFTKVLCGHRILSPLLYKFGLLLEKKLGGLSLKSGGCKLCRACKLKINRPCTHPDRMRFSLEATGIDVRDLALKLGHELLWYKNHKAPRYTSVVGGLLLKEKYENSDNIFSNCIKEFLQKKNKEAIQG